MAIKTVLIEDNKIIRDALVPTLMELGDMEIMATAEGAQEAISVLHSLDGSWQLAIVDLSLKQGSGLEVLTACREHLPSQTMVVLSNYVTKQVRQRCMSLGADGVFDKSTQLDSFFDFCQLRFQGNH